MSVFAADSHDAKTPVFVLTGFLGSGKTTLLNRWLRDPQLADTAVIVNEIGEIGLDHLLVQKLDGEVALLQSGCLCCSVRSDLETTLRDLLAQRDEGRVPAFARVVIETTGLADPAPIVQLLDTQPLVSHFCALAGVITTVDAVNGERQLAAQWEARKQVALADLLLLTKVDLAPRVSDELASALAALNPHAEQRASDTTAANDALAFRSHAGARAATGVFAVLANDEAATAADGAYLGKKRAHEVRTLTLTADAPLDWMALQSWLGELRAEQGERLLRLKGIVRLRDEADPVVLHGVHHLFHPPERAPGLDWPAMRSVLVLVTRDLDGEMLRAGFAAALNCPPISPAA